MAVAMMLSRRSSNGTYCQKYGIECQYKPGPPSHNDSIINHNGKIPMALMDWLNSVWQNSGLAPLWETIAPWLALDERQLIFMVATPFFIGVFLWEFLKIRHNAELVDSRESIRNFMLGAGYQTTELTVSRPDRLPGIGLRLPPPLVGYRADLVHGRPALGADGFLLLLDAP